MYFRGTPGRLLHHLKSYIMSVLASVYLPIDKLKEIVATLEKKGEKGFKATISIQDESKEFKTQGGKSIWQNVSLYAEQTKEQQQAKAPRYYVGNGGVFWHSDSIHKAGPPIGQQAAPAAAAAQAPPPQSAASSADDLPF